MTIPNELSDPVIKRRVERYTALAGLLDGTLRYGWAREMTAAGEHLVLDTPEAWAGILEAGPVG